LINGVSDVLAIQQVPELLTTGSRNLERLDLPDGHLPAPRGPVEVTAALTRFLAAELSG
jgi:hypothetical protein